MKKQVNRLKEAIESKLINRTDEQLKNDAREAMKSDDYGANVIFVTSLSILEERLTQEDYKSFEDSL